ncbi:serine/threonine-protein kinase [Sphaerisporangium viridialbum]|uniref:serine/threonine-protein kinase n=1 Tax=Sphaerisporangium viridialbum TaxID=46189 RepID=UPI003C77B8E9
MPEQQRRLLADRYELITPLGRGTMGTVWRAHDRLLGRDVAVKEIRQDSGLSKEQRDELRERMIREGRTAAKIAHPSVATVHDAIVVDGSPWIIMELVEARSLEQVIDEEGPLPPRLVAEIGLDLLGALGAAHDQGILHRDVKPGNVLLTDTGRVVLTDFGIAKAAGDSNITKTGMVIGSPGYTAPERARGDHTGPESDLWSLGATLYFAVEGRPAYERDSVSETLAALMTEQADPATQAGPLRPALEALLEKDHTKRLTHDQAVSRLRAVARTSAAKAAASPPHAAPPKPPATQKPDATVKTPTTRDTNGTSKPAAASSPPGGRPSAGPSPDRTPGIAAASAAPPSPDASEPGTGSEPDVDPNQTMMVIRPKGGLRIPGVQSEKDAPADRPAPARKAVSTDADEDGQATMVGLLPPIQSPSPAPSAPAARAPRPAPPVSRTPPAPTTAPASRTPPARQEAAASHATAGVQTPPGARGAVAPAAAGTLSPQGAAQDASSWTEPATPENGLGTDLFAFQGTAPPRGSSPAGMIILVGVALLGLAAIVMLVAAAVSSSGATDPNGAKVSGGSGGGTTASTVDAGASTTLDTGSTSTATPPASGLRRYIDKTGYIIDLPSKLRGVAKGGGVGFSAEGDVRTVRISRSANGTADVLGAAKAAQARAVAAGTYPGYKLIRLAVTTPAPYPGTDVADWEFTYTASSGPAHVLSRWVAVPGGDSYAIYWSTPEAGWKSHRPQLETVLSSFQPARRDTSGGS